ncbi:MAG: hemerythrin domain-containing protein [Minwuia sp.]|uniref:hemerythrin domain-containing protein n=1 Tax=Minwuia sp. TaxID=2493630 RepID=UPI003A8BC12B
MKKALTHSPLGLAISEHLRLEAERSTTFAAEHRMINELCDELEEIADGLPTPPRPQQLRLISAALKAGIPAHCRQEESELRGYLARWPDAPPYLIAAVEQLATDHAENEPLGFELADILDHAAEVGVIRNPDALGYLMRLYFHTMRRHLAWEEFVASRLFTDAEVD